jgi:two-component system KDP operon response regulator KdpE
MHNVKSLVLIACQNQQTRKLLKIALNAASYRTEEAETGNEAIRLTACIKPDLFILSPGFKDTDSIEIVKKIREWSNIPLIYLADANNDESILEAFKAGIDDYIIEPFNTGILVAKINAIFKRSIVQEAGDTKIELGNILVDLIKHEVKVQGKVVQLSPKEYNLLVYLIKNKGKMLTHTQILNKVWGPSHAYDTQYLRVYIGQLRKKIDAPNLPSCIINESGIGYRMEPISSIGCAA